MINFWGITTLIYSQFSKKRARYAQGAGLQKKDVKKLKKPNVKTLLTTIYLIESYLLF